MAARLWAIRLIVAAACLAAFPLASTSQPPKGKKDKPDLYVLAAQIDTKVLEMGGVPNSREAELLGKLLTERSADFYDKVHVKVLKGKDANRDNILGGLKWLDENMKKRDVAMVFLAGHGGFKAETKQYKYFPVNGPIDGMELRAAFAKIPGRSLLLLQTCQAHGILETKGGEKAFRNTMVICACDDDEKATRLMGMVMAKGLYGPAAEPSGTITTKSLTDYLEKNVGALSKGVQNVQISRPTGFTDFPLVIKGDGPKKMK